MNIHIDNSYMVFKSEFKPYLTDYHRDHPDCDVFNRSMFSLCMEWATHNALYALHIARKRTKDVDLNYPCKIGWLYCILGPIAWLFIK